MFFVSRAIPKNRNSSDTREMDPVIARDVSLTLPTYLPAKPDRNPMFLERRVYQGSGGRVYPLPFIDRIEEKPTPVRWRAIILENEFLEITILPEIGGRVHRLLDKTNGYDAIYYQPVIKPALVGLAGPWISGGIEFNWPQHHRPSTFMPAQTEIEREGSGAVTVWLSEHDPMARMKGMHGVRLYPGSSVLELRARVYNRTADIQTFLWWANVAAEVHEHYQSFFPPDATFVADHAKRAMSTFPRCGGKYYGVDYAARPKTGVPENERPRQYVPPGSYPPDDLSWYANIPVPTSYMCMGSRQAFFGGYDHRAKAGLVHVADPQISPGKKQWTWGNHEFGYAWDRLLTDPDGGGRHRPYVELMAGVYTDNQPDFAFLEPGETKSWSQFWYPIREIGPAANATREAAASLRVEGRHLVVGVHPTSRIKRASITISHSGQPLATFTRNIGPENPFSEKLALPRGCSAENVGLEARDENGRKLVTVSVGQPAVPPSPQELENLAATEPPAPSEILSSDELYFTGLHLEQYRHATRCPEIYWREGLRRDPGDARCNLAMGRWHLRRGEFAEAARFLEASVARQTQRNPNPSDGEALYQLGRALSFSGETDRAYASFGKAAWNRAWASASFHALAEIDCARKHWLKAKEHIGRSLRLDSENLRARALEVLVLRELGLESDAKKALASALALDPLDAWLRCLAGKIWLADNGVRLDVAFDFARAGFFAAAEKVLAGADKRARDGSLPMVAYTRAWLLEKAGKTGADAARKSAASACPDYCFPSRLEEIAVLESALATAPQDARANLFLGFLLYDKRRHSEAISRWETSARNEPGNAVAWRCLGIAYFNAEKKPDKARRAFARALKAAPDDGRILHEGDQLAKRLGDSPQTRLRKLSKRMDLVKSRDDLAVEFCALLCQTGKARQAAAFLGSRNFQPWEGGEGLALGMHVRAELLLGREDLRRGSPERAISHFGRALAPPPNLGEANHPLANQSDIHYWLGRAKDATGDRSGARNAWRMAANARGDFRDMSVRQYSEMTYFSALSMRALGQKSRSARLFRDLLAYGRKLENTPAKIDYFATSLPAMLLFEDDLGARQTESARFLQAQALLGLGRKNEAARLLRRILDTNPNHALAADMECSLADS